jgi:hypothetical protein
MREARRRYFERNDFCADGGYQAKWVHFKLGPLPLTIPNTASRVRAVAFHDLHHVVTGYSTDYVGEFEISAWEIGAGCRNYWAAWFINLGGVTGGAVCAPRRTWRAFVRGRRSASLYGADLESLLDQTVAEARDKTLRTTDDAPARILDVALFGASVVAGLLTGTVMMTLGALAAPLVLGITLARSGTGVSPPAPTL